MGREARVCAADVLVRQPQETHPLRMQVGKLLAGLTITSIAAVRKWVGNYPGTPHLTAEPEELTLGAATFASEYISIPCEGGAHGTYYYVEVDFVCSDGATRGGDGWVHVKDHDS